MIISLSYQQLNSCRHWGTARHKQHLVANRERTTQGHACAMPAIAWRTLADRLTKEVFYASTGRHRKTRLERDGVPATRAALQKIEQALANMQMHPALHNQKVVGYSGDVVIAWPLPDGKWSLYPVQDQAPVFFVPVVDDKFKSLGVTTSWRPQADCPADLPDLFPDLVDHVGWLVGGHDVVGVAEDHRGT